MKTFATLTVASLMALAGAAAIAQTAPTTPAPGQNAAPAQEAAPAEPRRQRFDRADLDALTDARIAGIQAGLKLTPEQQRLWGPVEQALRAQASQRAERLDERGRTQDRSARPDLMMQLERRAEVSSQRAETLRNLSTAMKPFWASLDDTQKRRLPALMRTGGGGRYGRQAMRGGHHGHMMRGDRMERPMREQGQPPRQP
ncbi:MAG TPA: Spy/CpxP family protein refolding chaperone [Microvirga sp.]|jgi:hypothetical protein